MTSIQTRRANVLAEAIVSSYINELATPRERPAHRPAPQTPVARLPRLGRERVAERRALVAA